MHIIYTNYIKILLLVDILSKLKKIRKKETDVDLLCNKQQIYCAQKT